MGRVVLSTPYDVALDEDVKGLKGGACNTSIPYWEDDIESSL
jgi:hypothetical protein